MASGIYFCEQCCWGGHKARRHKEGALGDRIAATINNSTGVSLEAQEVRIHLPRQRTQVRSLVRTLRSHIAQGNKAHEPQLLSLCLGTHLPPREKPPAAPTETPVPQLRPHAAK